LQAADDIVRRLNIPTFSNVAPLARKEIVESLGLFKAQIIESQRSNCKAGKLSKKNS